MQRPTEDRLLLAAFGCVAIFCLCSGCQSSGPRVVYRFGMKSPASPVQMADSERTSKSDRGGIELVVATETSDDPLHVPPSPAELAKGDSGETLSLTIADAVAKALSNNMHLRVVESLPGEAGARIEMERAGYDASFNTNAQYLNGSQQVASALQAVRGGQLQYGTTSYGPVAGTPNLFSVEQRFSTGTTARVGLGPTYNYNAPTGQYLIYNPAYQSSASLVVEQALFRGANRQANLAGIKIAETGQKQSSAEFQVEVNQTLTELQRAYWLAWLAISQVKTFQELLEQAKSTQALEQRRLEIGKGGIVQAASATENMHSLKAELAQAQQRSRAARNHLFTLMGISPGDRRDLKLMEEPLVEEVKPDLNHGLTIAASQRPEIQIRQLQVNQAQLELDRRTNNMRPDVRAYAGYSLTGLNNSLLGSVSTLGSGQFGMMSLGVRYTYVFGQRADKAALEQARLAFARQTRARQETEFQIQQQVRDAWDAVNSSWEVWRCQQERVAAARIQVDTFSQLHAAGQIDLDRVLRARQQLANGLQQSHSALVDYNLALNNWRFAIGAVTTPLTHVDEHPNVPPTSDVTNGANVRPLEDQIESSLPELIDNE